MLYSPMEQFEIFPVLSLSITLNNVIFYLLVGALISPLLQYIGVARANSVDAKGLIVPTGWGIVGETLYRTILSMVETSIGKKQTIYFPLLYTLFFLILFSNLIGLVPYSSTPTVEFVMTLTLSVTLLIGVLVMGFVSHNTLLAAAFLPAGTPLPLTFLMIIIEVIAYITRTLSLGLRLAVNMITGHILVKVVLGFVYEAYLGGTSLLIISIPLLFLVAFLSLEILIAYLQAYIFTFITCITIKDMAKNV